MVEVLHVLSPKDPSADQSFCWWMNLQWWRCFQIQREKKKEKNQKIGRSLPFPDAHSFLLKKEIYIFLLSWISIRWSSPQLLEHASYPVSFSDLVAEQLFLRFWGYLAKPIVVAYTIACTSLKTCYLEASSIFVSAPPSKPQGTIFFPFYSWNGVPQKCQPSLACFVMFTNVIPP